MWRHVSEHAVILTPTVTHRVYRGNSRIARISSLNAPCCIPFPSSASRYSCAYRVASCSRPARTASCASTAIDSRRAATVIGRRTVIAFRASESAAYCSDASPPTSSRALARMTSSLVTWARADSGGKSASSAIAVASEISAPTASPTSADATATSNHASARSIACAVCA